MGSTSTQQDLAAELRAKYEALDNKRSREGVALRRAIAKAEAGGAPESVDEQAEVPEAPEAEPVKVKAKKPKKKQSEAIAPPTFSSSTGTASGVISEVDWGTASGVISEVDWTIEGAAQDEDMGILPSLTTLRETERASVYWMGVLPGNPDTGIGTPPAHQIDGIGGGLSFHEWWTPYEGKGQDGSERRGQFPGHLVSLTETQVAQLREGLRSSLVRWRVREGFHRHGYVIRIPTTESIETLKSRLGLNDSEVARIKVRAQAFQVEEHDEPVARYIYCVKVTGPEAVAGGRWRPSTTLPPSVEQLGTIEGP
jgi:hypothetical protein